MSTNALLLVIAAAGLHALWNAVVKASGDRLVTTWGVVSVAALANIPILVLFGLPVREVWWMVGLSALIHAAYNLALVVAYRRADLSFAYPVARGTAPLLVTIGGVVFLGDRISSRGFVGVLLVTLSLGLLATQRPIRHATWAVVTGLLIASYTLVDGAGVRISGDSVQFVGAVFVAHAVLLTSVVVVLRGYSSLRDAVTAHPGPLLVGGTASAVAYLMVMVAALTEPLGLVAGVREVSALFGVALGAGILKERITSRHALAVLVAVVGIVAIASN